MTSVERAQRFLKTSARTIALTVVPLASASASTLTLTSDYCYVSPSGGGVLVTDSTIPTPDCETSPFGPGADGVAGLKLYGTGSMVASFDTYLTINITDSGEASGSGGIIPVYYDFTLSNTSSSVMDWDILFSVFGTERNGDDFDASNQIFGTSTGGTITGTFNVNATAIVSASSYVMHVEATDESAQGGDIFTLDIPPNSIDVDPPSTPEPSSLSLFTFAFAPLVFLKWLRTRRG